MLEFLPPVEVPGEVGPGLTGVPFAGATGALSALPNPMRTSWPFGILILPPNLFKTSSFALIASA